MVHMISPSISLWKKFSTGVNNGEILNLSSRSVDQTEINFPFNPRDYMT